MIDLILAPISVWFSWVVVGFLGKNSRNSRFGSFFLCVASSACSFSSPRLPDLAIWGPADAVETIDCSAPFIQCINADGDSR